MGQLSRDDILKLASLSRLALTDAEVDEFAGEISEILNPNKERVETATGNVNRRALEILDEFLNPTSCFPDYEIKP